MKKRVLLLIPARFQSSRFPGKPLAAISGISMIKRVLVNMSNIQDQQIEFESYVVTDDIKIEAHIKEFSPNVVRVDDDVNSGTLRIELAYRRFFADKNFDLVINVQGDEPLLLKEEIVKISKFHLNSKFDIATMVKKQEGFDELFFDTNKVKAVISEVDGRAFYFSRASIPHKRDTNITNNKTDYWFLHIGIYSFTPNALMAFATFSESRLENLEKLEQLRALENGLSIGAIQSNLILVGVDSPDDIPKVEQLLNSQQK
jgi:3-deoxy-manno-octulosonate cytidylyltransferase (CMP-KDO synthetase)